MIPHRTPFFLPLLYPSLIWRFPTSEKKIYLTFDDGPIPGPTEFVLEQLGQFKATFFCIGDNIRKHSDIFRRIIQRGHEIGNHTFNHLNGWKTSTDAYLSNIKKFKDTVDQEANQQTNLLRPPYGRITRSQIKNLTEYKIIMWDVLSYDYDKYVSPERCLKKTIAATRNGSIVVFHDSLKAERNMTYVLPRYIDHFSSLGYTFESIKL